MSEQISVRERIGLKRLVDRELDRLYEQASTLGRRMGSVFGDVGKSQLRNLETVAAAATRTSALKNHVKNQIGKDRGRTWGYQKEGSTVGGQMLKILDELAACAAVIVKDAKMRGSDEERRELARLVEIELQRGVVQTAVCAALYGDLGEAP